MIYDLFINAVILIAFFSVEHQILFYSRLRKLSFLWNSSVFGLFSGLLGIMLMLFSINITPTIILDFRNIPLIVSTLYGGFFSAMITGCMIAFFRVAYYGIGVSSISAAAIIAVGLLGFYLISKASMNIWKKWVSCVCFYLIISTIAFFILIPDLVILRNMLLGYWIGTSAIAIFVALYFEYLQKIHKLFLEVKKESRRDPLTGLYNVKQYNRIYNLIVDHARGHNGDISLLFLDIDRFKLINDTYGHAEGDIVLKEFTQILTRACRNFDFVFRVGGEEFLVILNGCSCDSAYEVAERIRHMVENHYFRLTCNVVAHITTSIGIASDKHGEKSAEQMRKLADAALYQAKLSGRNKTVCAIDNPNQSNLVLNTAAAIILLN